MPRTAHDVVPCLLLAVSLVACASSTPPPRGPLETPEMDIEEARQVVDAMYAANGLDRDSQGAAPRSIADLREIVRTDQLDRFEKARGYAARLSGVDAMGLRASLEALWADAQLTVAALFHERARRTLADLRTLEATRSTMDPDAAAKLIEEHKQQLAEANRSAEALRLLAMPHVNAARELAREAQRQNPEADVGYVPGAHADLLEQQWPEFDRQLRRAEQIEGDAPTSYAKYLRGLEASRRFADRAKARQILEEVVAESPEASRARARLILLNDTPSGRHEQLEQLKRFSPRHPIVLLAGPAIEREYVISQELTDARQQDLSRTPLGSDAESNPEVVDALAPQPDSAATDSTATAP